MRMDCTTIVTAATMLFSCRGDLVVTQSSLLAGLSTYVTEYVHKGVTEVYRTALMQLLGCKNYHISSNLIYVVS